MPLRALVMLLLGQKCGGHDLSGWLLLAVVRHLKNESYNNLITDKKTAGHQCW